MGRFEEIRLKCIGRSVGMCGRRFLIVSVDPAQMPRLRSEVRDRRFKPIGNVVDIFGNIKRPYAAVLCHDECPQRIGEKFFVR